MEGVGNKIESSACSPSQSQLKSTCSLYLFLNNFAREDRRLMNMARLSSRSQVDFIGRQSRSFHPSCPPSLRALLLPSSLQNALAQITAQGPEGLPGHSWDLRIQQRRQKISERGPLSSRRNKREIEGSPGVMMSSCFVVRIRNSFKAS